MRLHLRLNWGLFKEAASHWSDHNAPRMGAALAYYTVLSLAPLLVVVVAVSGFAFGEQAVRGQIYWQIKDVIGSQAAGVVQTLLKAAHQPESGIFATIVGFIVLLLGASGVFIELRDTLNFIWEAPTAQSSGIWSMVRHRFFSFAMVLGIGFLLMVSLALSAIIQAAGSYAAQFVSIPPPILEGINFAVTFIVTAFLFALIYKLIPEVPIDWEDVVFGAIMTAAFFTIGKFVIGLYLGKA
ncbi:MAG TPA: YihY/virulence factor BrkB family protein, partial [Bryobacteraceae bacterium]|nr:YihY/virulence factor BrkB family protein [Bryobacteraceae bacterium]